MIIIKIKFVNQQLILTHYLLKPTYLVDGDQARIWLNIIYFYILFL